GGPPAAGRPRRLPAPSLLGAKCGAELGHDLGDGHHAIDALDAPTSLPEVLRALRVDGRLPQLDGGSHGVEGAHPVLRPAASEQPACDRACTGADPFDVGRANDGEGHSGDSFGQDNVGIARAEDRVLVGVAGGAFGGCDEAGAELGAVVADAQRADQIVRRTDTAGAYEWQAERSELIVELLGCLRTCVAARAAVDGDESVHAAVNGLVGPLAFGDVVVHARACLLGAFDDPARLAERCDEEADAFLERDVDPAFHPFAVHARAALEQRVHADRFAREAADVAESFAEVVAMDVRERQWLDDADTAVLGHCRDELGVTARIHRAADDRQLDAELARHACLDHRRSSCQRTRTLATVSPAASRMSACASVVADSLKSGMAAVPVASSVPRALRLYSTAIATGMPRTPRGIAAVVASPLASSPRFASAIAGTDRRWLRTRRRSLSSTTARPGSSSSTRAFMVPV